MEEKIHQIFQLQQAHKYTLRNENATARIAKLKTLKRAIEEYEQEIYTALQLDLRKSTFEAAVSELIFVYGELNFAIKNLKGWMRPKKVGKTLNNPLAKNRVFYEPKGVCLVIAPWNYPFQLTMGPLISAIAAGNAVMMKPSELSPATSAVVSKILAKIFRPEEVACFEGDANTSTELLKLPFDHIFFTGSTAVGKVVMAAAAKHLSSVTLELGGKSPTIIDKEVNLEKAAEKIAWGKLLNSGQTCIAPDYVFIHESQIVQFTGLYKAAVQKMFFTESGQINHAVYGKIISPAHFKRIKALVDEALEKGARIDVGGSFDEKNQTIEPVVLSRMPTGLRVMDEEIFGPILPLIVYHNLDEVIGQINDKSKALALYIFSTNTKNIRKIIKNTSSGGVCVNDVLLQISNPKLPFGGVNGSGTGSSHGFFGFKSFSHERAVLFQSSIDFSRLIYPPYRGKEWVLKMLRRIM